MWMRKQNRWSSVNNWNSHAVAYYSTDLVIRHLRNNMSINLTFSNSPSSEDSRVVFILAGVVAIFAQLTNSHPAQNLLYSYLLDFWVIVQQVCLHFHNKPTTFFLFCSAITSVEATNTPGVKLCYLAAWR